MHVTVRDQAWGTHQAPAAGSCGSVLALPGSPSVLRRKDGRTCTCLSTLLLISSKVVMVGDLWERASGCPPAGSSAVLAPVITSGAHPAMIESARNRQELRFWRPAQVPGGAGGGT